MAEREWISGKGSKVIDSGSLEVNICSWRETTWARCGGNEAQILLSGLHAVVAAASMLTISHIFQGWDWVPIMPVLLFMANASSSVVSYTFAVFKQRLQGVKIR